MSSLDKSDTQGSERPTPTEGEPSALIAELRRRYPSWADGSNPLDNMPPIVGRTDTLIALQLADALSRTPGSMEGEVYQFVLQVGRLTHTGDEDFDPFDDDFVAVARLDQMIADAREIMSKRPVQPRPASTLPGDGLWLEPEISEDGDVIEITCFSPDQQRLTTIAVYPDKVIKVVATMDSEGVRSVTEKAQSFMRALASPPPGVVREALRRALEWEWKHMDTCDIHEDRRCDCGLDEDREDALAALAPAPQPKGGE